MKNNGYKNLEDKADKRAKRREAKKYKKPNMKVSGKQVFKLKDLKKK